MKRFFFTTLIVCLPALAWGAAAESVKIGTASTSAGTLSLWIAQEQGIFKKHGIQAQIVVIRGGPTLVSSLLAGELDAGYTTGVSFLGAAAQGIDAKMLTCISDRVNWKLIGVPQIKQAQDLRGKKIGVQSIVGTTWMNSMLALEQLGLDPTRDKIAILPTGDPATMAHALESGRIDAAVLDPVSSRPLVAKGFPVLVDLLKAKVVFPGLGLGVLRSYVDRRAPALEKVVAAFTESLAFVQKPANKQVVLKSMMKNMRLSDPAAAEQGYQDEVVMLNRKPYPTLEGMRNAQRLMALQNPKIGALKIEDLVDPRFVRKLDESGFIDKLYAGQPAR